MKDIILDSKSKKEALEKLGWNVNGHHYRKLTSYIEDNDIDISHFDGGKSKRRKWERIEKECPICGKVFTTRKGHDRETTVCSRGCSNTYFRSGINHPNVNDNSYRIICFHYHDKNCVVCGEDKIVAVHHYDEDRTNNNPENLIPMCPTHHEYYHSKYKDEVTGYIESFRNNFINN